MSDTPDILHEQDVRDVIQNEIEETVGHTREAITDASVAHALNATFSDTEVETALNALGTKLNLVLNVLRLNGLITD